MTGWGDIIMNKYDPKNPKKEPDPIYRCHSCQRIIWRDEIHKHGKCLGCGNRRVITASVLSPDELKAVKEKNIDPEFLALFNEVDDET